MGLDGLSCFLVLIELICSFGWGWMGFLFFVWLGLLSGVGLCDWLSWLGLG